MAETKRGPGRPPGSKNKNTKGKTDSKAKAKAQEIQAKQNADKRVIDEIWAIITIAIGVFLAVASFTGGAGKLGVIISLGLKGLFGHMAYVLPFYLIVFGILLFARQTSHFSIKTIVLLFVILLMLCTINSIRFIEPDKIEWSWEIVGGFYTTGEKLLSGGFLGMVLGSILVMWLGKSGCWIFTVVVTLICLLLLINTPVSRFFAKIGEKMEERRLIKENAHLDFETEDDQGIQVDMKTLPKAAPSKKAETQQAPQHEIKIVSSSQPQAEYIPPSQAAVPLTPEKKNSILKYMNTSRELNY